MVNIFHQRPRFDFSEPYLVKLYRAENVCLRLHCNLIKSVLDKQVGEQFVHTGAQKTAELLKSPTVLLEFECYGSKRNAKMRILIIDLLRN